MSRNVQGSGAVPGPLVPGHVRSTPSRWMLFWNVQVRTRMRCRLPGGRFSWTFLRSRCSFWTPRNESLTLEARSILHAVRSAESRYPPGRLLIFSDNLALVLAPRKGCSSLFSVAFSHSSNLLRLVSGQVFVSSFRWILSEPHYSDKGSRFFDCGFDSITSLLHVLAQR